MAIIIILITVQQSTQTIMHKCDYNVCTYLDYYKSDQGLRSWLQKEVKYSKF